MSDQTAAWRAALLELHARRLVAHGLDQRRHGLDGLAEAVECVIADLGDADAADAFARALGLVFTHLPDAPAAELADTMRAGVPPLIAKLEGTQPQ